jgi:hypothetical protein
MDMVLITQIMEIVIIPLLGVLTTYIIKLINVKINEISETRESVIEQKYLDMLNDTISDCVVATT